MCMCMCMCRFLATMEYPVVNGKSTGQFEQNGNVIFSLVDRPNGMTTTLQHRRYYSGDVEMSFHSQQLDGSWAPALPYEDDAELPADITYQVELHSSSVSTVQLQMDRADSCHVADCVDAEGNYSTRLWMRAGLQFEGQLADRALPVFQVGANFSTGEPTEFILSAEATWGPIKAFDFLTTQCRDDDETPRIGGVIKLAINEQSGLNEDMEIKISSVGEEILLDKFEAKKCTYSFLGGLLKFKDWGWEITLEMKSEQEEEDEEERRRQERLSESGQLTEVDDGTDGDNPDAKDGKEDKKKKKGKGGKKKKFKSDATTTAGLEVEVSGDVQLFGDDNPFTISLSGAVSVAMHAINPDPEILFRFFHAGGWSPEWVVNTLPAGIPRWMFQSKQCEGRLKVNDNPENGPYLDFLSQINEAEPIKIGDQEEPILILGDPDGGSAGPIYGLRIVQCYRDCETAAAEAEAEGNIAGEVTGNYLNCLENLNFTERTSFSRRRLSRADKGLVLQSKEEAAEEERMEEAQRLEERWMERSVRKLNEGAQEGADCFATPQFVPFWSAKICLDLGEEPLCGTLGISAMLGKSVRKLIFEGYYTDGCGIRGGPCKPLWFMPGGLSEVVVIQANDANPLSAYLEIDLTASPPEVLIMIQCVITINFEIFGAEPFDLSGSVFGRIGGGEKPAFGVEAVIPLEWFKDFHKAVRPPYSPSVFISNVKCEAGDSSCLIVPVQGLGGEFRELEGGLQMFWKGPSFIPALCVEEVEIALSIARIKPPQLHFMGKCEFDDAEWNITSVPTVNFFAFASLELFAKLTVYARGAAITFGMTAEFHLGTGNATCKEEDKKGDPSEGGCLVTEIEVELEVGVQLTPAGPEVNAIGVIRGETSGAWLDPLGLSNFAFIDPAIALGMKVAVKPCPSPSGICPTVEPQEFRFVLTVLWKRDAKREWPEELLWKADKDKGTSLDWPPDIAQNNSKEFLTLMAGIFFQRPPHDDELLGRIFPEAPIFCVKLQVSETSPADIVSMFVDAARGLVNVFDTSLKAAGLPGVLPALQIPPIDFSFIDELLPFKFQLDFELSTSEDGPFEGPCIVIDAEGEGVLFGFEFSFKFKFNVKPDLDTLFLDTTKFLRETGLWVSADVVLPCLGVKNGEQVCLGEMSFSGIASPALFALNASAWFEFGPVAFLAYFEFEWKPFKQELELSFGGSLQLGPLGGMGLDGFITNTPSFEWELEGDVDVGLNGFCMKGRVAGSSSTGHFLADLEAQFGPFGSVLFLCEIGSELTYPNYPAGPANPSIPFMVMEGAIEVDVSAFLTYITAWLISTLCGQEVPSEDNLVYQALQMIFDYALVPVEITYISIAYDSRYAVP